MRAIATFIAVLTISAFANFVDAQTTAPSASDSKPNFSRNAALLEVMPPRSIEASANADALLERLIRKHVALLQHPQLIRDVVRDKLKTETFKDEDAGIAELTGALKVRSLPGTALIEVSVARDVGGHAAGLVADWIVLQYIESEKSAAADRMRDRLAVQENLVKRYEFRLEVLSRSIDSAATKPTTRDNDASGADALARLALLRNDLRQTQRMLDRLADQQSQLDEDRSRPEIVVIRDPMPGL